MTELELDSIYEYPLIFDNPKYLSHISSWHGHIPFAFWCMYALKPKIFVELGTHYGDSYFAFCQAVLNNMNYYSPEVVTSCFAVDTWTGDNHCGFYGNEVYDWVNKHNEDNYSLFSKLKRNIFLNAVSDFADKSIDLLHIDGYHTYEATKETFETYKPKLSNTGVVLFHDTVSTEPSFGVTKYLSELPYPRFEFQHCNGLSVVCVGDNIPKPLDILLRMNLIERIKFTNLFAVLGYIAKHSKQVTSEIDNSLVQRIWLE